MATTAVSLPRASGWSKVGAIFRRDGRNALSYPGNFALSWIEIFVEVIIAWYISQLVPPSAAYSGGAGYVAPYFQYLAINAAFVRFQSAALNSFAESIRDAQLTGTLEIVLATPTQLPTLVLSSGVWSFTFTILQTLLYLGFATVLGLNLHHVDPVAAVVFLILTVAAISPLGVMAAALSMIIKKTGPVEWVSTASATLFAGVYFPLSKLPVGVQFIGWCLPITHALAGFRAAFSGVSLVHVAADALWLVCASVILMPLSLWLFSRAVAKAKVDGTLSMY